ncbi:unnamed protein product [Hymenolepis diminuta]|uniref:Vacuolar protein sorting-associated protein n=1 Tax=Hymenolepis diminuta TaxID=6216 RepID=A0A0R3SF30_HYMDI|nr:unnamed protein product [Hymenolepis diminuta]
MTEDPYEHVDIKVTEAIFSFIKRALTFKILPAHLRAKLEQITPDSQVVKFSLLFETHETLMNVSAPDIPPLWRLTLQSSEIVLPKPYIPPRSIVVQQRVDALKTKFANMEYGRMTTRLPPLGISTKYRSTGFDEVHCMKRQVTMVINSAVVVICSFVFGYFLCDMFGQSNASTAQRIATGFVLSLLVFIADLYFLLKNVDAADDTQNLLNAKRT